MFNQKSGQDKYQFQIQQNCPNFSVPPPPVNADLSHQQAEINRLTQVAQQWSAEGLCQYNQASANYNQDRFSTNAGRICMTHSTPNMSPVPHNRISRHFIELEQQRYGYIDQRMYYPASHVSSNANSDSTSIMINALENLTAKISVQPLVQVALGSI